MFIGPTGTSYYSHSASHTWNLSTLVRRLQATPPRQLEGYAKAFATWLPSAVCALNARSSSGKANINSIESRLGGLVTQSGLVRLV
jgi:hypothetical protein